MPRRKKTPLRLATVDENGIGRTLKELRQRRGMTQVELAAKLGVTQGLVSAYERGEVRLHAVLLAAFAKALGTSPNEILSFEPSKEQGIFSDRRFLLRLRRIDAMSKTDKKTVLKALDLILRESTA